MRLSVIVFAVLLGGCASHSDDPCEKVWSEVGEADGKLGFTAPLAAITAAVVGVIGSLALFFVANVALPSGAGAGFGSKIDWAALALVAAATFALVRLKWGVIRVIALCALAGGAWRWFGVG